MILTTVQFITGMKLRELHRQREHFRNAYEQLRQAVAAAPNSLGRLRQLYQGLQQMKFAGQPLHPEVLNLEIVLDELEAGTLSPEITALWLERLENELAAGQRRCEFVYLFGALLEEWVRAESHNELFHQQSRREGERLVQQAIAPETPNHHREFLNLLLKDSEPARTNLVKRLSESRAEQKIEFYLIQTTLDNLVRDIYQPPRLRQEARHFLANSELCNELSDAMTIFLAKIDQWDWPATGLAVRPLWTRNKWRLYLDCDLPTACLQATVGSYWEKLFTELLDPAYNIAQHTSILQKCKHFDAPQGVIENQRRLVEETRLQAFLAIPDDTELWDPDTSNSSFTDLESEFNSVQYIRNEHQLEIRNFSSGYDEMDNGWCRMLQFVHAEIQLVRAAFPDRPLYVVKTDLKDFYPSIPHDLLLTILEKIGVPEDDQVFFQRFLSPPLLLDQQRPPNRMRRGVPIGFTLSATLAELVLRFLDYHIRKRARVRLIRQVDDICLLTPNATDAIAGWRAIQEFCQECGLEVNQAKSGATCLGGTVPAELPSNRPRWGMLEMDQQGNWHVHAETFQAHLNQTRERVQAADSIFAKVQQYNANVRYLLYTLCLRADLGVVHRQAIWQAVQTFHGSFFAPAKGIVAGLTEQLGEKFQTDAADIPDSWVYWPMTAGGLGLQNPLVTASQYAVSFRQRDRRQPPQDRTPGWDLLDNEWSKYYRWLLQPIKESSPKDTKVMESLVDDFIERGQDISAGKQEGLSAYWRWILYTYGPQILQKFGTFRFLISELVPMQLIGSQLIQNGSLDEGLSNQGLLEVSNLD